MKQIELDNYLKITHEILFEILCDVDEVCRNNNIRYSLDSGTLLGAIRHQDFIPWDDDADVIMLRKDFEKFLEVYPKQKKAKYTIEKDLWVYRIRDWDNNPYKDQANISVDIFVLDSVPKNKLLNHMKIFFIKLLQGMMKEKPNYNKYNLIGKILSFVTYYLGKLFTSDFKFNSYQILSKLSGKNSNYKSAYNYAYGFLHKKFTNEIVCSYKEVLFHGKKFFVFKDSDKVLEILYGSDFMQPPPENERFPKHINPKFIAAPQE